MISTPEKVVLIGGITLLAGSFCLAGLYFIYKTLKKKEVKGLRKINLSGK